MTTPDPEATARQDGDTPFVLRRRGPDVQFAPGTVIAARYRIASILGSGGMGEVYRADDTKLGQPVALKFLPARLARDPILLGRLHEEVRLGRQITHPNVCRIYDIVEWEGSHFVSMEYVDGEDLARLLRRIGRVAHDKAVDVSRGIAAGLMAAHAKGILHRDLKPANVMIDSGGDARIMDFGLALGTGEDDGTISGTPAYMAPEQLAGAPATVQSDLYALGLIMYELFTGRRVHSGRTMPERIRDISSEITTPSAVIRDIDPAVERIILRCLASDPAQRPRSAREAIDALPGGDALAAALAAGETPSPRIVAAAGSEGSLEPWQAWTLLGALGLLLTLLILARIARSPTRYTRLDRSPEVLRQRAVGILHTLGISPDREPVQQIYPNGAFTAWLSEQKDPGRWTALKNGPGLFRYRLEFGPGPGLSRLFPVGTSSPGWTTIEVDHQGRLVGLLSAPAGPSNPKPLDWHSVLAAAEPDPASLTPVPPRDAPVAPFDARAAWTGNYPGDRTPIRIEAAAWQGAPVYVRITGAWDEDTDALQRATFGSRGSEILMDVAAFILLGVALFLTWRNLRLRRGDRTGAIRIAAAFFVLRTIFSVLTEISNAGLAALPDSLPELLGAAAFMSLVLFVLYIAIEPYARRRWPELLISWARLIAGRPRDPLVGRHVLFGMIGGMIQGLLAVSWILVWRGFAPEAAGPLEIGIRSLNVAAAVGEVAAAATFGIMLGSFAMSALVLFTIVLRKRALAAVAIFGLNLTFVHLATADQPGMLPVAVLLALMHAFLIVRYGLLAISVAQATFFLFLAIPFAPGAAWLTPVTAIPILVMIAASVWAFVTSLGGRSPFNTALIDG